MKDLLQINKRKPTRQVNVGNVSIGNGNPISIQTMTTTLTHDIDATLRQTERCVEAGAQIVRVAVPEERDAKVLPELVKRSPVPIVADIHFNYRYALAAVTPVLQRCESIPVTSGLKNGLHKSSPRQKLHTFRSASVSMKDLSKKTCWTNTLHPQPKLLSKVRCATSTSAKTTTLQTLSSPSSPATHCG